MVASLMDGGGRAAGALQMPQLDVPPMAAMPSNLMPFMEKNARMANLNTQQRYANDFFTAIQRLQGYR